jgi:predicted kinase
MSTQPINSISESSVGTLLSEDNYAKILSKLLTSIPVPARHSKPFIFAPVGLIGSGKTTITKLIADEFNLVLIRTDDIRSLLTSRGFNHLRTPELSREIAFHFLNKGCGIAIDADMSGIENKQALLEAEKQFKLPICWIHINTPESTILERLSPHNTEREYVGKEAIERYFSRKQLHENLDIPFIAEYNGAGNIQKEFSLLKDILSKFLEQYYS